MKKHFISYRIIIFFLFISNFALVNAQDSTNDTQRYGLFFNYRVNSHIANFKQLPGIANCCPQFSEGSGKGFSIGASWELPLPNGFFIGLKAGYGVLSGTLTSFEPTIVRVDSLPVSGEFEHIINAYISEILIEPYFSYNVFGGLELFAGGHAGILAGMSFDQEERITKPTDRGVFLDTKTRVRNRVSGDIPDAKSVYSSIFGGVNYSLPLNKNKSLFLVPEISYMLGMSDLVKNLEWKIQAFQMGLSVKYRPEKKIEVKRSFERKQQIIKIDTAQAITDASSKRFFRNGIEKSLEFRDHIGDTVVTTLRITRTDTLFIPIRPKVEIKSSTPLIYMSTQYVSQTFPILPSVFFGKDSTEISSFYDRPENISIFDVNKLVINPVVYHKNILNIIGLRMKNFPESKITLYGYADSSSEKSSCNLARSRSESIRRFLVSVWGVDSSRIEFGKSSKNCVPPEPTMSKNDSGYADNRRVEIQTDDEHLLAPISQERYLEATKFSPQVLKLTPEAIYPNNISTSSITASQGNNVLIRKTFNGKPEEIEEKLTSEKIANFNSGEPINIEVIATDFEGNNISSKTAITIRKDTSDVEIQRLSLILFGVSSDIIPDKAKPSLKEFVRSANHGMKATVYGYSDILGIYANNLALSERRAVNTARFIHEIDPKLEIIETKGIGSDQMPPGIYSFSTPAERFLTRTVYIELQKKWKE